MTNLKPVSKEEFYAFLRAYPGRLVRDVFGAPEPPIVSFNDFALGAWPKSVVASYRLENPVCGWHVLEDQRDQKGTGETK